MNKVSICWFRQDLRITDNPALSAAAKQGEALPVYILDDTNAGNWAMGGASRLWLHHALTGLNDSLDGNLRVLRGDASELIPALIEETGAQSIHWNRCYEPWRITRDKKIMKALKENEIEVESHNGSLLWEPWDILKKDGTPYQVYTPFYRKGCLGADKTLAPRVTLKKPRKIEYFTGSTDAIDVDDLELLSGKSWEEELASQWEIGEGGARKMLDEFLDSSINEYKKARDFPARAGTSFLSPYLHFGQISPHQVWHAVSNLYPVEDNANAGHFCSELAWREFSYYLLYHWPTLPDREFKEKYAAFPWENDQSMLQDWKKGNTGIPIVDAGMRELWQTGYMHNRVRMIVASLLIKNMLVDWREGERWFWDCLFDADLANNAASWQWVAGSGADAAPYFRIFNPVLQGKKFDPEGEYVKRYCPELASLPEKYIHEPWAAPAKILDDASVVLGETYPEPIVDLKASRERALSLHKGLV